MSESQSGSGRSLLLVGLFVFAAFWVIVMSAVVWMLGSSATAGAAPTDDGSVKAQMTSVSRGKDFQIDLSLGVRGKDGNILEGLSELDFEVFEDGVPVLVRNFMPAGQGAIRLAMIIDCSSSMSGQKIEEARKAARALLRLLRDKHDHVGLYFFNEGRFYGNTNTTQVLAIEPLDLLRRELFWDQIVLRSNIGNGSPMYGTMKGALDSLVNVSGRKVLIVLTDGRDNTGEEGTKYKEEARKLAQDSHIPIYMISTSSTEEDKEGMTKIAEDTKGRYVSVPEPKRLQEIFEDIGKSLQNDYTMSYTSPNPVEDGQKRNVAVNVRSGRYGTQTAGSYSVGGAAATGGGGSSGGGQVRGVGLTTIALIFVVLAGVLGVLSFVPNWLKRLPAAEESTAGSAPAAAPMAVPVAATATPAPAATPAIRASKPPMPPPPPPKRK